MKNLIKILLINLVLFLSSSFSFAIESSQKITEDTLFQFDDLISVHGNEPKFVLISSQKEEVMHISCNKGLTSLSHDYILFTITDRSAQKKAIIGFNDDFTLLQCQQLMRSFFSNNKPIKIKFKKEMSRHMSNLFMGSHLVEFVD